MSALFSMNGRCAIALVGKRSPTISFLRSSHVKTPVQQYGYEYLKLQEKSGRPLSPHLSIYKPQLTWMLSGFHRISGCVMAGTLLLGGVGFALLPIDFTTFVEAIRGWNLPFVVTDTFKFIVAFPIFFHTLNGIRFLGFDLAKGTDLPSVYRSGWLVVGLSALLSVLVILNANRNKGKKKLQKSA